jgi:hypothetical protein
MFAPRSWQGNFFIFFPAVRRHAFFFSIIQGDPELPAKAMIHPLLIEKEHVIFMEKMNGQCSLFPTPAGFQRGELYFDASIILIKPTKIIPLDALVKRRYLTSFMCICLFMVVWN